MIPRAIGVVMWPDPAGVQHMIVYVQDERNIRTPGRAPRLIILAHREPGKGWLLNHTTAADSGEPYTIERPMRAEARVA